MPVPQIQNLSAVTDLVNPQISTTCLEASQVQVAEWIQEQFVETVDVIPQATQMTLNTSSTSTSGNRLDELASMLDSCLEQPTPLAAMGERIEKETERIEMFTKRRMETPSPAPPLVMSPLVEPADRTSSKRRRRTRYAPFPGILQHAVYLAPNAWPRHLTSSTILYLSAAAERRFVRDAKEELRYIGADYDTVHR